MEFREGTCPICGKYFFGYPALSRKDNKTEICQACGFQEAVDDFLNSRFIKIKEERRSKNDN